MGDATFTNPRLVAEIINALVEICTPGDPVVLATLSQQLTRGWWPIRIIALQSIKALAPASSNCAEAKATVLGCLRDDNADVRECAVEVLGSVARAGDGEAIAALEALREEGQPVQVDEAIEEALETLSADTLPSPPPMAMPLMPTSLEYPAASEASFQMVDGRLMPTSLEYPAASEASFQMVDGSSESSFQVVDG